MWIIKLFQNIVVKCFTFHHFLHRVVKKVKENPKKEGEVDPKFWEVLLSAQKKDYERICQEFGITDYRWMLKRLNQMKKEREEKQAKVSTPSDCCSEMDLKCLP